LDYQTYPARTLAELYYQRWSVEALYKTIKQTLTIEDFHAQSLRGIQQELTAGLTLIALVQLMSIDVEMLITGSNHRDQ